MEFLELKKLVYGCQGQFKTRQHLWHECINRINPGDVGLEFGVWHGTSINYFANARPDNRFHGFDSFDGLPEDWTEKNPKGKFKVQDRSKLKFAKNVTLHDGWFEKTLPPFLDSLNGKTAAIKFLHIDCDLGSSTNTILEVFERVIIENKPAILFDELYGYHGFEEHEFLSFLNFVNRTGVQFEIVGRNILREQCLVQIL